MIKKYSFSILSFVLLVLTVAAQTATRKPIEIDFFTKVKRIANLKVNNDNVFFTIGKADKEKNNYSTELLQ